MALFVPSASASTCEDAQGDTRVALLEAAVRLFSEKGVEGTSVREISKAAGANLAAINYHFGSKERLAVEVFTRRLEPVNRERIARLDALEAPGQPAPTLAQIVEAIIRPGIEGEHASIEDANTLMRLISRSSQEPNRELKKFAEQQFAEMGRRFDAAVLRAVPGLTPEELFWRMNFLIGALHHAQEVWLRYDHDPLVCPPRPAAQRPDRECFIRSLCAFVAAGFAAPLPPRCPHSLPPEHAQSAPASALP